MNPDSGLRRLARLQRECDVNIGPMLLLCAASAALLLVLALNALLAETASAQVPETATRAVTQSPTQALPPIA